MSRRGLFLALVVVLVVGSFVASAQETDKKKESAPPSSQPARSTDAARKAEVLNKLETLKISMDFKDATLQDVIDFLREMTRLNFIIDRRVYEETSEQDLRVTFKVDDLSLKSALKLILSMRKLSLIYREGVLMIVPKSVAEQDVVMRIYDVRDLLCKIRDFPGPNLELVPPGDGGNTLGTAFDQEEPASSVEDPDFVVNMIKTNTCIGSWDQNPKVSVSISNGLLVISQTREGHKEVLNLINKLRAFK